MISASAQMVERALDEARGPEGARVDPHAGEARRHLVERVVEPAGQRRACSCPGSFSTTSCSASSGSLPAVTASPISGGWSSTTVATSPRRAELPSTGTWARSSGLRERQDVPDPEALVGAVQEAAGARGRRVEEVQRRDELGVARRPDDVQQRDVAPIAGAPGRRAPAADGRDGPRSRRSRRRRCPSAAGGRSTARAPRARSGPASATRARSSSPGSSTTPAGSSAARCRRSGTRAAATGAPGHELAGAQDVGPALEEQRDRRQARHRVRADRLDALDAVEQVLLERNGEELLDLRRPTGRAPRSGPGRRAACTRGGRRPAPCAAGRRRRPGGRRPGRRPAPGTASCSRSSRSSPRPSHEVCAHTTAQRHSGIPPRAGCAQRRRDGARDRTPRTPRWR